MLFRSEIEPKLKEVREQYKDQREEQARAMMAIYQEAGLNPFAAIFLLFLQIPIIIALYFAVSTGGGVPFPEVNAALLYDFVPEPAVVSEQFLGFFDISGRSIILAALAAVAQYFQVKFAMPAPKPKPAGAAPDLKDDLMRSMQTQLPYVLPVVIFIASYTIGAAIALYFFVSNLTMLAQELVVRKHR